MCGQTADRVAEIMARRPDHNASPERTILHRREAFGPGAAPGATKKDGGDYSD